jgi:hypothetical protein
MRFDRICPPFAEHGGSVSGHGPFSGIDKRHCGDAYRGCVSGIFFRRHGEEVHEDDEQRNGHDQPE